MQDVVVGATLTSYGLQDVGLLLALVMPSASAARMTRQIANNRQALRQILAMTSQLDRGCDQTVPRVDFDERRRKKLNVLRFNLVDV